MKKRELKLVLHKESKLALRKETLRELENRKLEAVAGGAYCWMSTSCEPSEGGPC
jgi:natural product precursor